LCTVHISVVTDGTINSPSCSGSVGATTDALHFAYQQRTGSFDIKVRVSSVTDADGSGGSSMAGLMARGSLLADAPNVFVKASAKNDPEGFGLSFRKKSGTASKERDKGEVTFPDAWVRLQRVRNTFIAYRSIDGLTWVRVA